MHVVDRVAALEQVEHQRRGNVVRQVADDAQAAAALVSKRCKIELERVGLVNDDARVASELLSQERRQVAIDLDEIERCAAAVVRESGPVFEQRMRQRAATRTNLDHVVRRSR